jgi:hypothetical protein
MVMADAFVGKVGIELKAAFENGLNIAFWVAHSGHFRAHFQSFARPLPTTAIDPACLRKDGGIGQYNAMKPSTF